MPDLPLFIAVQKGKSSDAINNDVHQVTECEADVMTWRDPWVSVSIYFLVLHFHAA